VVRVAWSGLIWTPLDIGTGAHTTHAAVSTDGRSIDGDSQGNLEQKVGGVLRGPGEDARHCRVGAAVLSHPSSLVTPSEAHSRGEARSNALVRGDDGPVGVNGGWIGRPPSFATHSRAHVTYSSAYRHWLFFYSNFRYGHVGSQLSVLAEAMGMRVLFTDVVNMLALGTATQVRHAVRGLYVWIYSHQCIVAECGCSSER
jgi:hypothetical protein